MINSEGAKLVVQNLPPSVKTVSIPGNRVDNNFLMWLVKQLKFNRAAG
jgi:hypothetical protein